MNIKRGTTPVFVFNIKDLNVDEVQEVIFTFISESDETLDPITIEEPETNEFVIGLTQQQSLKLKGATEIEAQINYKDKHQEKTKLAFYYVDDTLGTKIVEGNKPNTDNPEAIELILERIQGDVALVITPEASDELIDAVTAIFNDTKDVADSVRRDADAGMFNGEDGQDGFSPQVTVKTETPSTYVLHIKDANHEYDTPNLQGQGGEGTIEAGDGLKREGNVVSVDNGNHLYFSNGKLNVSTISLGISDLRSELANTSYATPYKPLATREYVDNLISTSLKRLVVDQLPQNPNTYTIYMVLRQAPTTNNIYDEYMYINNAWELIGSTEVDLSNYYTKSEVDTALGNKQNTLSVSEKLSLSSDTLSTSANQVYNAQTNADGTINTSASMYADIKRYDLIIRNSGYYGDNYFGGEVYRVNRILNGTLVITQITDTFSISGTPPTTATSSDTQYKIGDILFSDNGNIYLCTNKTYSSNTWTYTWRTYGGSGLSYTFTDGLAESSGTVGIDLKSGTELQITNDQLDIDLSSYATTTDLSSKQDTIDSSHKLSADNVDDTSTTNKFVPTVASADYGKYLHNNNGTLEWSSVSGGGSYSGGDGIDITNDTISVDLKSGTELQITSGELDIDLSNYATTTSVSGKEDKTTITTDTTSTTVSLTLADNHEYRYTQDLTSLTLTMPNGDFISSIVFASGSTPTSMTYDSSIKWSGDDVTNGQFVPSADKDYDICLYYNGLNVNGIVRGV